MKPNHFCLHAFLFGVFVLPFTLFAQPVQEWTRQAIQKMEWYKIRKQQPALFVHFDKNVYAPNETVWCTGYLLGGSSSDKQQQVMAVALMRNEDSMALAEDRFVLSGGLSFGSLQLPDSLQPGYYRLIAYTNSLVDGKPAASFIQPVTIKTATKNNFSVSLKLGEPVTAQSDSVIVVLKASVNDIFTLVSDAPVNYTIGTGKHRLSGSLITDAYGNLRFKLPMRLIYATDGSLQVRTTFKKESKLVQLQLPLPQKKMRVTFLPEGGNLAASVMNRVGWEVKDMLDEPLMTSGVLYQDGVIIDTIQTNGYGMGQFRFVPIAESRYSVRLISGGQPDTTTYLLPRAYTDQPSIKVEKAVCDDTLCLVVQQRNKTSAVQHYRFLVHNYSDAYRDFSVAVLPGAARTIKVALDEIPKGFAVITVLDSLGRPVAERLFFAHYNQHIVAAVTTDSSEYHTRQKIKLNIQLKDQAGKPVAGMVSVACVQDNRIDQRKMPDIESYFYLQQAMPALPYKKLPMNAAADSRDYLEDVLLVKGWRRYSWPELMQTVATDTSHVYQWLVWKGEVKKKEKKPVAPVHLSYVTEKGLGNMATDSTGRFTLSNDQLLLAHGKKLMLFVSDKRPDDYSIHVSNPYQETDRQVFERLSPDVPIDKVTERNSEALALKAGEAATTLATVTVTSSQSDHSFVAFGSNACGDYVCQYGILNCQNHPFGTPPVEGKVYRSRSGMITYLGCEKDKKQADQPHIVFLKGVYTAKEFYSADYTGMTPTEEMFLSTLYWNHLLPVSPERAAELSFSASDITGRFRVVIQGFTDGNLVTGEQLFRVVK